MNEETTNKPVWELLQDIRNHRQSIDPPPHGLIEPKLVHRITFFASLAGLMFITVMFLGVIWEFTNQVFAFRCIFSTCVVLVALYIFRSINSHFE